VRRRWLAGLGILVLVAAVGAAAFFFWPARLDDVSEARARLPDNEDSVHRGRYLAQAADCAACHTLVSGKDYAGGLPFKLPFGTIYASNITPDRETGIGAWSDAEFVRAVRHGVGRGGEDLYPSFPYASYALMSTEDALAIKDYLFSLEPVRAEAPQADLRFPYNQRYLMRAWKLLFVPSGPLQPDPGQDAAWNRGAYLVEALGHCGECHTPRNRLYGLDDGRKFAGAITAGWKAYNITSDQAAGIGAWSDQELASYLASGYAPGRGAASGSMAEAVEYSLRHLTGQDIAAMVAYLRTVPPQGTGAEAAANAEPPAVRAPSAFAPLPVEAQTESLGLSVFQSACASCHGFNGEGLQHPHAALAGAQSVNDPEGTNLLQVLIHGSHMKTDAGDVFMPAFGSAYSDVELAAVANYAIGHFGGKRSAITPANVAAARTLD
jgi:mono/diheme cytochrome c family protein